MPNHPLAQILAGQRVSPGPGLPPIEPPRMPMPEAAGPGPVGAAPIRPRNFIPGATNPLAEILASAGFIDPKAMDAYPSSGGDRKLEFLNKNPMDESMSRSTVKLMKQLLGR